MQTGNAVEASVLTECLSAVQGSKINLDYSREHKTYDGLRYNCNWNAAMLQSEDLIKSVMAVMSKDEEADFEDL